MDSQGQTLSSIRRCSLSYKINTVPFAYEIKEDWPIRGQSSKVYIGDISLSFQDIPLTLLQDIS